MFRCSYDLITLQGRTKVLNLNLINLFLNQFTKCKTRLECRFKGLVNVFNGKLRKFQDVWNLKGSCLYKKIFLQRMLLHRKTCESHKRLTEFDIFVTMNKYKNICLPMSQDF